MGPLILVLFQGLGREGLHVVVSSTSFTRSTAFIIAAHAIQDRHCDLAEETLILGGITQLDYVRFVVFFGCLGIFVRLVRGELAERTLHYSFLAAVRREVLVVGKFLAGD